MGINMGMGMDTVIVTDLEKSKIATCRYFEY